MTKKPASVQAPAPVGGCLKVIGFSVLLAGCLAFFIGRLAPKPGDPSPMSDQEKSGRAYVAKHLADCHRTKPPEHIEDDRRHRWASSAKVADVDVLGVRLYDSPSAVMAAVTHALGAPAIRLTECAADWIAQNKAMAADGLPPDRAKSCVGSVEFVEGKTDLTISFTEDLPSHPGCMAAVDIDLSQPGRNNSASEIAWQAALLKKYGPREPYLKSWGSYEGPELEDGSFFSTFVLRLKDEAAKKIWEDASAEFINDAKPVGKPKL